MAVLFIETDTPPPFYQEGLTDARRKQLDQWFIGHRSQGYYLKRFQQFDQQGHLSAKWHWAGFAMTLPWLLYRKRYIDAIVYSVAGWSFIQVTMTIILLLFEFLAMDYVPIDWQMMVRICLAVVIWVFWAVLVAMWSDAYYYRVARREIADALDKYPRNEAAQKAHLQGEGGVSYMSMGLAIGFFAFSLFAIQTRFLPLIAKHQEQKVLLTAHQIATNAKNRVKSVYQQTGKCPINVPVKLDDYQITLAVTTTPPAVKTDCAVVATVHGVPYPNRYLNGQTLVLYHPLNSQDSDLWKCSTSLNKKQKPKKCVQ